MLSMPSINGVFDVTTLEMIEGDLPARAQRLVRDWAEMYKDELQRMWETQDYKLNAALTSFGFAENINLTRRRHVVRYNVRKGRHDNYYSHGSQKTALHIIG